MSDTDSPENDDDGGIFCQSCSPTTRKVGYILTFAIGWIGFLIGIIMALFNTVWLLIVSSVLILFCPLWVKSPKKCFMDFRSILKVTTALIFITLLVLNIVMIALDWSSFIKYLLGIMLAVAGFMYFLSFFPNGQKACFNCIKTCCEGCCAKSSESS